MKWVICIQLALPLNVMPILTYLKNSSLSTLKFSLLQLAKTELSCFWVSMTLKYAKFHKYQVQTVALALLGRNGPKDEHEHPKTQEPKSVHKNVILDTSTKKHISRKVNMKIYIAHSKNISYFTTKLERFTGSLR